MGITGAIGVVGAAVDALAAAPVDGVSAAELRENLAELKAVESKLTGQLARLTHAADSIHAYVGTGARDTAEWLGKTTGTSSRRNRRDAELGEAMARSDDLADAIASGDLSSDKAAAAVGAAGSIPVDAELLDQIGRVPLASVRPTTEEWRAQRDGEREADRTERQRARRFLRLTGADDGMTRVDGLLDPASAAIVRTTLDSIMSRSAFDESGRTRDQRCVDALTQLAKAASKGEIAGGRSNAKVLATAPFETVCERSSMPGRSHAGPTLSADTIRAMCCDAGIHRVVTGPGSSILDFGRENRLVSDNLFLALVARDQHCRWPGCTIRATWCDAHHIIEWTDGGPTDESNCALLCNYHHSVSHLPGWSMRGDAHEFVITRPDGDTEVSRPPTATAGGSLASSDPPDVRPPRADSIGEETSSTPARSNEQLVMM